MHAFEMHLILLQIAVYSQTPWYPSIDFCTQLSNACLYTHSKFHCFLLSLSQRHYMMVLSICILQMFPSLLFPERVMRKPTVQSAASGPRARDHGIFTGQVHYVIWGIMLDWFLGLTQDSVSYQYPLINLCLLKLARVGFCCLQLKCWVTQTKP